MSSSRASKVIQLLRRQHVERLQRRPHPQFRMPAAGDQLLGLGEELDLADAAAADLDVVAFDRDLALAAIGLHLPLHVVDVGERCEVEMLAPDERRDLGDQRLARLEIAGAGPRLDHGGALPGPPFPLVIMQRRFGRDRHLRRGRIGPQPQIDAEHVAVAGALLQQPRQCLRHPHEKRLRLDIGRERGRCGIEEHDQVDVAGIIQLARAHLAHGEHDQAAAVLGMIGIGRRCRPRATSCRSRKRSAICTEATARSVSAGGDPHHRPDPADVAQRDQQRRFRLHAAEQMHHLGLAGRGQHRARGLLDQRGEMRLRVACQAAGSAAPASARTRSNR